MAKSRPSRITPEILEREAEVLKLRRGGLTFDMIAERVGYKDPSGAHQAYVRACKRIIYSEVEELRKVEADRLDIAQAALWSKVLQGDVAAVNSFLRVMERRAKLFGLDMPMRQQVEVTTYEGGSEIDREVERLAQLLQAADSRGADSLDTPTSTGKPTTA
jgi:hypothetical protein